MSGYAEKVWPKHRDGTDVRFGEIWDTPEFGKVRIEQISFTRDGLCVGDNAGHVRYFRHGESID